MVTQVAEDVKLTAVGGRTATIGEWTTTFQLLTVVIDPYTHESAWLLETAGRVLANFRGADCRVAWTVTADERDAKRFLGPWAEEFLTFADPERDLVKALDLERLPALAYIRQDLAIGLTRIARLVRAVARGLRPMARDQEANPDEPLHGATLRVSTCIVRNMPPTNASSAPT